ncbi:hypothetical protein BC939DRAFT_311288 [Gamsiella multidivaricata]|uniref:uncharacterized protein n=1 Tax=Gamsiella multidivaricata TaxID=101098 RepID=UPI00221F2E02|nr:uncharacterized protein BC939DRAFT_311288 [Gamsiella multidivaricata]KAI7817899.1 hypothetical protein BC939DRAFT_311288 [Gamsiella multidivaricata]
MRRIKDIVDQCKAQATSSTSIMYKQPKSSTSSSLSLSTTVRPGLTSSHPSQRSIATISRITKRTKKNIPMIPISPLTKQALSQSYALSQVSQRLEQAKQGLSPQGNPSLSVTRDLANLRRLIEDVRIQRAKLDSINLQVHSVATSTIISWEPDLIARQLTIIDTQLFKDVIVPKDLVRADRKLYPAQHCIDFETYVAHSVAHLLLVEWNTCRQPSPVNTPAVSKDHHTHAPVNAVAHMIRVANILLNVYRNFNSFMAVMRALTSPEIKRMHKLWSGVSSKAKDSFKRLISIYCAHDNVQYYKEALVQKLDAFQDVGKDAVIAIPWMRYHVDEVKGIINSYLTGHEPSGGSADIVLSAPGARKLSAVTALLMQCRTNGSSAFDRQDMDDRASQSGSTHTKHREPVQIDGLKAPLTPIWDLVSLGAGDIALHHWLLSRPFLNKHQLIDESLEIEPLFNGEELPCYEAPFDNDNSEESEPMLGDAAQDDSFEHVIPPEHDLEPLPEPSVPKPKERPSLPRTPVSETEINQIMNELLDDDASDSKGLFDDINTDSDDNVDQAEQRPGIGQPRASSGRSRDVLSFLGIDAEDYSDSDNDGDQDNRMVRKPSTSDKGKGKAVEIDDAEEINKLLAQVKGLVHESRSHTADVESTRASEGLGLDFQGDVHEGRDDDEYFSSNRKTFESFEQGDEDGREYVSSGRAFEPFQQGDEEDQFDFDGEQQPSGESPSGVEGPSGVAEVSTLLSLESLRKQLKDVGRQSDAIISTSEASNKGAIHKQEDRTSETVIKRTNFSSSPPMSRITASALQGSEDSIDTAKTSLTSHGRLNSSEDGRPAGVDESTGASPLKATENGAAEETQSSEDNAASPPVVSIQELDKKPLDSSLPSFERSTSSSPSESTTATNLMTTTIVTSSHAKVPDSEARPSQLGTSPLTSDFEIGSMASALDEKEHGAAGESSQPVTVSSMSSSPEYDRSKSPRPYKDDSAEWTDSAESEKFKGAGTDTGGKTDAENNSSSSVGQGDKSSAESADGRAKTNRQRRRIAGGVISSKSLIPKVSKSSLSSAFQESASGSAVDHQTDEEHGQEHEQGQGQVQDETHSNVQEEEHSLGLGTEQHEGSQDTGDENIKRAGGDTTTETSNADVNATARSLPEETDANKLDHDQ